LSSSAVPAIFISLIGETWLDVPLARGFPNFSDALISSSVIAPIVEEVVKGAALLGIFLFKRQEFDGPLDGVVYGSMIGLGFGMTENFFYFMDAAEAGGLSLLGVTIFLRAVIFGLNHACYTGLIGIGFGMARNTSNRHPFKRLLWPVFGLCAAILLHSLHNFGASTIAYNALGLFISLLIGMLAILLLFMTIMLSWRFERNCIREELIGEIGYLLNADEYHQITKSWSMPLRKEEPELAGEILRLRTQLS